MSKIKNEIVEAAVAFIKAMSWDDKKERQAALAKLKAVVDRWLSE